MRFGPYGIDSTKDRPLKQFDLHAAAFFEAFDPFREGEQTAGVGNGFEAASTDDRPEREFGTIAIQRTENNLGPIPLAGDIRG